MSSQWILASSNPGKLAEYRALFAGTPIELLPLRAGIDEIPEETGASFVENALIKARHAAARSGRPAIADDSGLCVDALGGAPGVHSARFAGDSASDDDNIRKLLSRLEGLEPAARGAAFHCAIVALRSPSDPAPLVACGCWPGRILDQARGDQGFGYDPVFLDPDLGRTAAELAPAEKNALSHRGRAGAELRRLLGF